MISSFFRFIYFRLCFLCFKGLGFACPFPLFVSAKHTQEPYPED